MTSPKVTRRRRAGSAANGSSTVSGFRNTSARASFPTQATGTSATSPRPSACSAAKMPSPCARIQAHATIVAAATQTPAIRAYSLPRARAGLPSVKRPAASLRGSDRPLGISLGTAAT